MFRVCGHALVVEVTPRTFMQAVRLMSKNHYQVLGLTSAASAEDVRKAFLKLSKQLHPDVNKDPLSHDRFVRVNEAYTVLSKKLTRQEYDENMAARMSPQAQRPHSNTRPGSFEERVFWDETIWYMRDRSKDKADPGPYYGVKGISRMPNMYIVLGCLCFMSMGALMHYFAITRSRKMYDLEDRGVTDTKYSSQLNRPHGRGLKMELIKAKIGEKMTANTSANLTPSKDS